MSSRLIINGHVWERRPEPRLRHLPKVEPEKVLAIDPKLEPQIESAGDSRLDAEEGLRYRIATKLDLNQGWLLDEQVMRKFGLTYAELIRLAKAGFLDAAMEQGSPTKRFRIRDEEKIRAKLHEWGLRKAKPRPKRR